MKTLIIGLDGATFDIIKPMINKDILPNFKKLMEEGSYGNLQSTIPPVTCPAWPSIYTGVNPGKHGIFDFVDFSKDFDSVRVISSDSLKVKAIWDYLGLAGFQVGLAFLPLSYPPKKVNGFWVSGGVPSPKFLSGTFPKELYHEILTLGRPSPDKSFFTKNEDDFLEAELHKIYSEFDYLKKLFNYLIDIKKPDFFMMNFNLTDYIQHFYWRYINDDTSKFNQAIHDAYISIDDFLGEVIKRYDKQTDIFIISDHGFGLQEKMVNINNFLIERKILFLKNDIKTWIKKKLFFTGLTPYKIKKLGKFINSKSLERKLSREKRNKILDSLLSFKDIDFEKTIAFSKGHIGQIFLNKSQTQDREKVLNDVVKVFLELRDPRTDERLVEKIYFKKDIFWGRYSENGPDLVLKMKNYEYVSYPLFSADSSLIIDNLRGTSGGHRENGIFIAYGPNIVRNNILEGICQYDITPTILSLYGQPIPNELDGRVMEEIFIDKKQINKKNINIYRSNKINKLKIYGKSKE